MKQTRLDTMCVVPVVTLHSLGRICVLNTVPCWHIPAWSKPGRWWSKSGYFDEPFGDLEIAAIFASIGGDDSTRILCSLDPDLIRSNPKTLMGSSDTSTQLMSTLQHGLVTFNARAGTFRLLEPAVD